MVTPIARRLWWLMLWLIRRPAAKRLQQAALHLVPVSRREQARLAGIKQERFARKYGLALVTFCLNVLALSILTTLAYAVLSEALERGWIVPRT